MVCAGQALVRLGGERAERRVAARLCELRWRGSFRRNVGFTTSQERRTTWEATTPSELLLRGRVRLEKGDPDGALADFDRAFVLLPTSAPAPMGRADVLFSRRRFEPALAECRLATQLAPLTAEAWQKLGRTLRG